MEPTLIQGGLFICGHSNQNGALCYSVLLIKGDTVMPQSKHRAILSGVKKLASSKLASVVHLGFRKGRPDGAQAIQMQVLPRETPQIDGFQIACALQPAREVSGDYFDVLPLGADRVGLCIADVSGKGVAAALLMANIESLVKEFARAEVSPAVLCSRVNTALCGDISPGSFAAFFYAVLDGGTRTLHYESAGHSFPLLVHSNGSIEFLAASSGVVGLFSHWTYSDHQRTLVSGDVVVMMTDGVLDAWNAKEEEFGYRRLIDSVLASREQGAHGIRQRVLEDVTTFCRGRFRDDAALIVVTME